jgi:predicted enzyme related to lactoylglutathione lyase
MQTAISWFEIPATDFDRAVRFYEGIMGISIKREMINGFPNGFFVYEPGNGVGGAIISGEPYQPGASGPIVYLHIAEPVDVVLARVEQRGGKVLMGKTNIGEFGFIAYLLDTEGNRVAINGTA